MSSIKHKYLCFVFIIISLVVLCLQTSAVYADVLVSRSGTGNDFTTTGNYFNNGFMLFHSSAPSMPSYSLDMKMWLTATPSTHYYVQIPEPDGISCEDLGLNFYTISHGYGPIANSVNGVKNGNKCDFDVVTIPSFDGYAIPGAVPMLYFYDSTGSYKIFTMEGDNDFEYSTYDIFTGGLVAHGTPAFTISDAPFESCSDGIQNQDETGIDTGGVCEVPLPSCTENCFSSVLFLPGIMGSYLKKDGDTLWPPSTFVSNDLNQLALTDEGESVNDIYVDGIIDSSFGVGVYNGFSDFMNSISGGDKLIKEWLPLAYDWRFMPDKILDEGIKTVAGTIDVIAEIERLADESKSKKVTIVGHSMGGLMGKAIIKKLQEEGKDNLIDSFVMVGTPQLGTPETINSILHGGGRDIKEKFVINPIGLRRVAQSMPSAYNLLPSQEYFYSVLDPVVTIDPFATSVKTWLNKWGPNINTYSNFISFLTGGGGVRTEPADNELQKPEVLRNDLLTTAANFHNEYDNYEFPEHINVVQIAGWGAYTIKGLKYKTYHGLQNFEPIFTVEGDETVVYRSAISSIVDATYFFDLAIYNSTENIPDVEHKDFLNALPVQEVIKSVLESKDAIENSYIKKNKPDPGNTKDKLIVHTHSPVILGAYDESGNFTGIDLHQDLSAEILGIKEEIPGSTFYYTSESQYIFLPKEGNYDFVYKGTGSGPTTVKIDNFINDNTVPVASYTDIPTTPSTVANFEVQSSTPENTVVAVDTNGDGAADDTVLADPLPLNELLSQIKQKISALSVKDKIKQNLLKQISNLEKKIENKKIRNARILANIKNNISKQEMKGKINTADATVITNMITELEAQSDDIALDPVVLTALRVKIQSLVIKENIKINLLTRVENLEKKQALIKNLSNLSNNITKKLGKGKISETDAQQLLDLISQIESVI